MFVEKAMSVDVVVVESNPTVRRMFREVLGTELKLLDFDSLSSLRRRPPPQQALTDKVVVFINLSRVSADIAGHLSEHLPAWLRPQAELVVSHANGSLFEEVEVNAAAWLARPFRPFQLFDVCHVLCPSVREGRTPLEIPPAVLEEESDGDQHTEAWETVTAALRKLPNQVKQGQPRRIHEEVTVAGAVGLRGALSGVLEDQEVLRSVEVSLDDLEGFGELPPDMLEEPEEMEEDGLIELSAEDLEVISIEMDLAGNPRSPFEIPTSRGLEVVTSDEQVVVSVQEPERKTSSPTMQAASKNKQTSETVVAHVTYEAIAAAAAQRDREKKQEEVKLASLREHTEKREETNAAAVGSPPQVSADFGAWPLFDVLRHIDRRGLHATLDVFQGGPCYTLFFFEGGLDWIEPTNERYYQPLKVFLMEAGVIDQASLDDLLCTPEARQHTLKDLLVIKGVATAQQVYDALIWQVNSRLWDALQMGEGQFQMHCFRPDEIDAMLLERPRLQLDVEAMLFDVSRSNPSLLPVWHSVTSGWLCRNSGAMMRLSSLGWHPEEQWLLDRLTEPQSYDGIRELSDNAGIRRSELEHMIARLYEFGLISWMG